MQVWKRDRSWQKWIAVGALAAVLGITGTTGFSGGLSRQAWAQGGGAAEADEDFDRLDGVGKSGKRVDVIEWEGNLEIHVYPSGSLKGLALKLDKRNKNKPVMVIGYRFDSSPKEQLIRRNILTIDMTESFKVYKDSRESEFDKIIITSNTLSSKEAVAFALDAEPQQLYPEGHPALKAVASQEGGQARGPAGAKGEDAAAAKAEAKRRAAQEHLEETGAIQPFFK